MPARSTAAEALPQIRPFYTRASTAAQRWSSAQCTTQARQRGITCTSHSRWLVYSFYFIPVNKFF